MAFAASPEPPNGRDLPSGMRKYSLLKREIQFATLYYMAYHSIFFSIRLIFQQFYASVFFWRHASSLLEHCIEV